MSIKNPMINKVSNINEKYFWEMILCSKLIELTSMDKETFKNKINNLYDLKKKRERINIVGSEENDDLQKKIFLQIIDFSWSPSITIFRAIKTIIGLRSYGQRSII